MPFTTETSSYTYILRIQGKFLGSIERDAWEAAVRQRLEHGDTQFVIDLTAADFMDSTGIGLLVKTAKEVRAQGGEVRLAGLHARVKNLFVMSRLLGPVFENHETVEAALQEFATPTPSS